MVIVILEIFNTGSTKCATPVDTFISWRIVHCLCPRCSCVSEILVNLGVEAKHVDAADVGKKVTEEKLKVATEEVTHDTPAASLNTSGKHIDLLWRLSF